MLTLVPIVALACCTATHPQPTAEDLAPHAAGVCLARVIKIKEFDGRPADGPMGLQVSLRPVRASGEVSDRLTMGLIADMRDEPLRQPGSAGGNHPLWVLGHLTFVEGNIT